MTKQNYFYYVITEKHPTQNKFYSYAKRVHGCNNLKFVFGLPNIINVTAMPTLKKAERIAAEWNEIYILNKEYMYQ